MILPEPRGDTAGRRGRALLTTVVFSGVCYGLLVAASYSIDKPTRELFREVDFALFAPPAPVLAPEPAASESEAPETAPRETTREPNASAVSALDQLDLSAFLPQELDLPVEDAPEATRSRQPSAGAAGVETADALSGIGDLSALDGLNTAQPTGSRGRAGAGRTADIALASGAGGEGGTRLGEQVGGDTRVVGGQQARQVTGLQQGPAVERISLDALGDAYSNLEVRELIDWMKKNPAELPIGIRQLVRHRPSFLSSVASFSIDGKAYELYLMCKESLYEVHIVLVEQEEATYLVDRSFQKLSTYLREGGVRRDGRDIVAVNSRRDAASSEHSREFYGLFLSWWEQARTE
ncbi:MAG: hypothetical protein SH809_21250 [Rhodothermales bacterium]|nr:hypothetical protein [Rhodothermales bacterium]